jgi:23S rRNA (cytidine1920-2'-O)/16S rRNA (cytidine1409-2'-O)-methyltransferase
VAVRRRLDVELVRRGLVGNAEQATEVIVAGLVIVGGAPAFAPARLVAAAESVHVRAPATRYVSRGGEKLAYALDRFALDVADRRALDAGASTGGFTDCLLQHGARHVVAVDVGRGQLAWALRADPRITLLERTNVRDLEPGAIGGAVDVVTADLSFISLVTVAPALARCSTEHADLVLLVKPQFEAGPSRVGEGGVVREPEVHRAVLREVRDRLAAAGLTAIAAAPSPLRGADGNVEFLFHARTDAGAHPVGSGFVDDGTLDAVVDEAHARQGPRR